MLIRCSRFYVVSSSYHTHRVLKIDRTDPTTLNIVEDAMVYDDTQLYVLLRTIQDGNKSLGGYERVLKFK